MSIIVKNSQLTKETISALNTLIESDINASSAFRLTRIIKELSSIIDDKIKTEKRILDKWIEKGEDGLPTKIKGDDGEVIPDAVNIINVEQFSKEMQDLLNIENTLTYDKLNFDDLKLNSAKVKDLIKLDFLFN